MAQRVHSNHLVHESSPYLQQHAHNPVDWYPWGPEALARAKKENKPIFLSIGYAACHWCHVMERESFENVATADLLNAHFVAIKVDREERPDIDAVYMTAVQAMTGSGGWPLNVFLTPDLKPFYGGTYFPPERRWGAPSFREVLQSVAQAWQHEHDKLVETAGSFAAQLAHAPDGADRTRVAPDAASERALATLSKTFERKFGGFGTAPKFPTPSRLFFLAHVAPHDASAREMLKRTLDGMAAGGMYDWVGGGFHRYSVDAMWLIPHFEKMLYDNALLARAYGEAGVRFENPSWIRVARETADYLIREMQGPEGGFYSSTDADSEGDEGRFFTWTADEVRAALAADEARLIVTLCRLDATPNFEDGRSVLRSQLPLDELARILGATPDTIPARVDAARERLYRARQRRYPPALDDKRLAGWNGMAIWSLAWLGAVLGEPHYLAAAQRCGRFVLTELVTRDHGLVRSWRDGKRTGAETLEDVAWLSAGLVELYQADGDVRWIEAALRLVEARLPRYQDGSGALYESPADGETLPMRPRNAQDGATPSSVAVMVDTLRRLSALSGRASFVDAASRAVAAERALLGGAPHVATALVEAAVQLARPPVEIVVVGDASWESTRALLRVARRSAPPGAVLAWHGGGAAPALVRVVPLFEGREHVRGRVAQAYVCRGGACLLPTGDPDTLKRSFSSS